MKSFKEFLIWLATLVGMLALILLAINAWYVADSDARLAKRWAQIHAEGQPSELADLASEPIPRELNAATYLGQIQADVTAIEQAVTKLKSLGDHPIAAVEEQKAIREALEAHPNVLPLLEQAAAAPGYDPGLDYSLAPDKLTAQLMEQTRSQRAVARVLRAQALLLIAEGKRDEAVHTAVLLLQLARHFDRSPLLVNYLVSAVIRGIAVDTANRALQVGPVTPQTRAALDAQLAVHEPMEGFRPVIAGERVFGRTQIRQMPARNLWLYARAKWNQQELAYLDVVDRCYAVVPGVTSYKQFTQAVYQARLQAPAGLDQLALPGLQAAYEAVIRTQAMIRCLRVVNALQAHPEASDGAPPKLSDLGLPGATTTDSYSGEPLHVKRLPEGWQVYSVGRNLTDEGGKLDDATDVGVGPILPVSQPGAP